MENDSASLHRLANQFYILALQYTLDQPIANCVLENAKSYQPMEKLRVVQCYS